MKRRVLFATVGLGLLIAVFLALRQTKTPTPDGSAAVPASDARGLFGWLAGAPRGEDGERAALASGAGAGDARAFARGIVIDALDRTPIANARIILRRGTIEVAETSTADDGRFSFRDAVDAWSVHAAAPGYAYAGMQLRPEKEMRFALEEAVVVTGIVVDGTHAPVDQAEVLVVDTERTSGQAPRESRPVTTGPDGRFHVEDAPSGTLEVRVEHETHPDGVVAIGGLGAARVRTDVTVVLGEGATISGIVRDPSGKSIANVSVEWRVVRSVQSESPESALTDAEGKFVLHVAPADEGFVYASSEEGTALVETPAIAGRETRLSISVIAPSMVEGTVTDERGLPIEGARIVAEAWQPMNGVVTEETTSDATGHFHLRIPAGRDGAISASTGNARARTAVPEGVTLVALRLARLGRLRIASEASPGRPLFQFTVEAADGRPASIEDGVWVGPAGEWTVISQGGASFPPQKVTVPPAPPETVFALLRTVGMVNARKTRFSGRVVGPDGKPVAGALVSVARAFSSRSPQNRSASLVEDEAVHTNRSGRFSFEGPRDARRLFVFHPEYRSRVVELIATGDSTDVGDVPVESGTGAIATIDAVGFGIAIAPVKDDTGCMLSHVYESGSAHKAGLRAGDELLVIDAVPIEGQPFVECGPRFGGRAEGAVVMFRVRRGESTFEVGIPATRWSG